MTSRTTFISSKHARSKLRVLIGGCHGSIGRALWEYFTYKGFEVVPVSRHSSGVMESGSVIDWGMIQEYGLPRCDYVINATGHNFLAANETWNEQFKQDLEVSRVMPTKLLAKAIREADRKPMAYVSTSSVWYYPSTVEPLDESFDINSIDDLNLSYLSRLERAVQQASVVYNPNNDLKPNLSDRHFNVKELYNVDKIQAMTGSAETGHPISSSSPDAAGVSPFAGISVRSGQRMASIGRATSVSPDENNKFEVKPSSFELDSNPITNEQVRVVNMIVAPVIGSSFALVNFMNGKMNSGLTAPIGNGKQLVPWIHESDMVRLYLHALVTESIRGRLNAVAPVENTNEELVRAMATAAGKHTLPFNIPEGMVEKRMGPVLSQIFTETYNVKPTKALNTGFKFRYTDLKEACNEAFSRPVSTKPIGSLSSSTPGL